MKNRKGFVATAVLYSLTVLIALLLLVVLRNSFSLRKNIQVASGNVKEDVMYYDIIYDGNTHTGGSMPNSKVYVTKPTALSKNLFVKDKYEFLGWALEPDGEVVYEDEEVVEIKNLDTIKITLYAKWRKVWFQLVVDPNGGTFNETTATTQKEGYIETKEMLPIPQRTGYTFIGWEKTGGGKIHNYGTSLFTDESFATGFNSVNVYNNSNNGNVTVQRVGRSSDSPIKDTSYMLQITTNGTASPNLGGFYQSTQSKVLGEFYHVVVAKVPEGYELSYHNNSLGTNSKIEWVTDNKGTGEFETYIYKVKCGTSGTFSTFGYVALKGAAVTAANPVVWYVAYSSVIDASYGTQLFADPMFTTGVNGMTVYNGSGNGTVTLTRTSRESTNLLTGTNYMIRMQNTGTASPGIGGYVQTTSSKSNGVYYHMIYAKIPVGYKIEATSNTLGNGFYREWLTPQEGTGEYETYIYRTNAGVDGTFSTFGHVYLTGTTGTTINPVTWNVGYSTVYDAGKHLGNHSGYVYEYIEEDAAIKAKWRLTTYDIVFNGNGGSGVPATQTKTYEITLNLPTTIPTRTGYKFLGWSTSSTATSATYKAGAAFTTNADTTLYAVWERIYAVTYNYSYNGGTAISTSSNVSYYAANENISLTPTATKSGYTFVGWNTNANATTRLSSLKMGTSAVTLYAIYSKTLTLTLKDYNGNTPTTRTSSVTIFNRATSGSITLPNLNATGNYCGGYTYGDKNHIRAVWTSSSTLNVPSSCYTTATSPNAADWTLCDPTNESFSYKNTIYTPGTSYTISANTTLYGLYGRYEALFLDGGGSPVRWRYRHGNGIIQEPQYWNAVLSSGNWYVGNSNDPATIPANSKLDYDGNLEWRCSANLYPQ